MLHLLVCALQVLHYRLTLSFLLLACYQLREAVGPADIVQWAADGQLPYLHFCLEYWGSMAPYRKLFTVPFLTPKGECEAALLRLPCAAQAGQKYHCMLISAT